MIVAAVLIGAVLHVGAALAAEPGEAEPQDLAFRDGQVILTPGEINVALRFELFQRLLREGAISVEEYQEHRQPNLGALLPFSHDPGSAGLDAPSPTYDEVTQSFRELRRAVERGVAKVEDAANMRARILSAILPRTPRERASRPAPPQNVMDGLQLTSHLAGLRGRGVITEAEFEAERRRIDDLAHLPAVAAAETAAVPSVIAPTVAKTTPPVKVERPAPAATPPAAKATSPPPAPVRQAAVANPSTPAKSSPPAPATKQEAPAVQLPVPRFASLRGIDIQMRTGPGEKFPVDINLADREVLLRPR